MNGNWLGASVGHWFGRVLATEQELVTGGWWPNWYDEIDRRKRRRKKLDEEEAEIARLRAVDREIASFLRKQEQLDDDRETFARIARVAEAYADRQAETGMNERVAKALARANVTQSAAALAQLLIEVERQVEEEDTVLLLLLYS